MNPKKTTLINTLKSQLMQVVCPQDVTILDDSASHAGHFDAAKTDLTHITVHLTFAHPPKESRIQLHRTIQKLAFQTIGSSLHACQVQVRVDASADPTL